MQGWQFQSRQERLSPGSFYGLRRSALAFHLVQPRAISLANAATEATVVA